VADRLFLQITLIQRLSRVQGQRICMRCQHGNCLVADTALRQSDPCENQSETKLLPSRTEPLQRQTVASNQLLMTNHVCKLWCPVDFFSQAQVAGDVPSCLSAISLDKLTKLVCHNYHYSVLIWFRGRLYILLMPYSSFACKVKYILQTSLIRSMPPRHLKVETSTDVPKNFAHSCSFT